MESTLEQVRRWSQDFGPAEPISIGWNCNTAHYLQVTRARRSAYPFDWIFSSPAIVADAIERRFSDFIDPGYIVDFANRAGAGHRRNHARMFNHGSPNGSASIRETYRRRIGRFLERFNSQDALCFIATVLPEPDRRPGWRNGFVHDFTVPDAGNLDIEYRLFLDIINRRPGRTSLVLIRQWVAQPTQTITVAGAKDCTLILDFRATGHNGGLRFINTEDDALCRQLYTTLTRFSVSGPS